MVIREMAVHIKIKLGHVCPESLEHAPHGGAGDAVAAVDRHLDRTGELDVAGNLFKIRTDDVCFTHRAGLLGRHEIACVDHVGQMRNAFAKKRQTAQHHLKAVVVGRIVGARHSHARAVFKVGRCKIKHGGGRHADIDDVDPCGGNAFNQCCGKFGP